MDGETVWIASISVILSVGVLPLAILLLIHKLKTKRMDTLVKLAEMGGTVDPDTMEMLTGAGGTYKTDYKTGLIWLAVGLPLFLGMYFEDGIAEATFGFIPVLIGLAYLTSGKLRLREK